MINSSKVRSTVISTFRKLGYNQIITDDQLLIDVCDDSLTTLELIMELEEVFDINIPINTNKGTVGNLIDYISAYSND